MTNQNTLDDLITIAYDIYNSIGPGYNEIIYHRAFEVALRLHGLNYESEVITPVVYKNHIIGHGRVDLIVNKSIIIELKAIANLNNMDSIIQIKNYMKQHNIPDGLIVNFGQSGKSSNGSVTIKYIKGDQTVFDFVNGQFIN